MSIQESTKTAQSVVTQRSLAWSSSKLDDSDPSNVAESALKKQRVEATKTVSKERFSLLNKSINPLARYVSQFGLNVINGDRSIVKAHLTTTYNVTHGKPTDQKSSGRCWIYGSLNMMRIKVLDSYGEDFQYSQNFVAFWDKVERANYFLEKMIEMKEQNPMDQRMVNMIDNLFTDGGEWAPFCNVVEKYGLVPDYAMPETEFSGNSGGYMALLQSRLNEVGGVLHKMSAQGASSEEIQKIKNRALEEVYNVLSKYLGTPPDSFYFKTGLGDKKKLEAIAKSLGIESDAIIWKDKGGDVKKLTPLEFYKMNETVLSDMVEIAHLPYQDEGVVLKVQDVGNVVEGSPMAAINTSMEVIKQAILDSIKDGNSVLVGAETKHLDDKANLFSIESDIKGELFDFDPSIRLNKADRLKYRATVVAHLMNIVGCDDLVDKEKIQDLPEHYGRLWKVENSWENSEIIYMTDSWFDEYVYSIVVDKKYLPEKLKNLWEEQKDHTKEVPAWDPYGRI